MASPTATEPDEPALFNKEIPDSAHASRKNSEDPILECDVFPVPKDRIEDGIDPAGRDKDPVGEVTRAQKWKILIATSTASFWILGKPINGPSREVEN